MATTAPADKAAKITVDLGDRQLYRRLRMAAVEEDMTVREIVIEAVTYWLDHREEIEDDLALELIADRKANPGGPQIPHAEVKRRLQAMREGEQGA